MSTCHQHAIISATNLTLKFTQQQEELTILNQLNLQAFSGESLALVGSSGAGKSSLLALLAGLAKPTSGKICWQDVNINQLSAEEKAIKRRGFLSLVFQSFQLLPELTALENVLLPLELNPKLSLKEATSLAQHWLGEVGLAKRLQHRPHQLSGGEQQRVALARAFATNPSLLLADEPTGNLDAAASSKITDLLFKHLEAANSATNRENQQKCLILVTHDAGLAAECSRQLELVDGQLIAKDATNA